jgi:hypothetical protein
MSLAALSSALPPCLITISMSGQIRSLRSFLYYLELRYRCHQVRLGYSSVHEHTSHLARRHIDDDHSDDDRRVYVGQRLLACWLTVHPLNYLLLITSRSCHEWRRHACIPTNIMHVLLVADSSMGISMVPAALLACLNFLFYMHTM